MAPVCRQILTSHNMFGLAERGRDGGVYSPQLVEHICCNPELNSRKVMGWTMTVTGVRRYSVE